MVSSQKSQLSKAGESSTMLVANAFTQASPRSIRKVAFHGSQHRYVAARSHPLYSASAREGLSGRACATAHE